MMSLAGRADSEEKREPVSDIDTAAADSLKVLARRSAGIMHRIWVDGTEFRWTREAAAA